VVENKLISQSVSKSFLEAVLIFLERSKAVFLVLCSPSVNEL
jgi:hypothetical protein